jgi:hypothetical protein
MTMEAYNYLKEEILKVNQDILSLISKAKSMPGMAETSFDDWEQKILCAWRLWGRLNPERVRF